VVTRGRGTNGAGAWPSLGRSRVHDVIGPTDEQSASALCAVVKHMADRESTAAGGGGASWAVLAATAAVSALAGVGVATVAARLGARKTDQEPSAAGVAAASPALGAPDKAGMPRQNEVNQEAIIEEHLARNIAFFGPDSVRRVRGSFVVVIGLGGVGKSQHLGLGRSWRPRLNGSADLTWSGGARCREPRRGHAGAQRRPADPPG